ncbi:hypothetical protein GCM10023350_07540 [Nocardioides endophyticus]|uniref:WD40 repeat domain-containing protein n=1 Tax=Nocardioides endophyticus TaxID=1353775 RepID=A0ABP8YG44_9ACTN
MTERLALLLRQEADTLDVPTAPADAILSRGRRVQRRRRLVVGATVTAGVVAVAGLGMNLPDRAHFRPPTDPAVASALNPAGWAVASGSTLSLGNGATVTLPSKVKSIYYTSAGSVVRTGKASYTDGSDSSYALVTDDGEVHSLGLQLGDRAPSSDPTLPYLAYAEKRGVVGHGDWTVVLRDVRTGDVAATIPIDGAFSWGGWEAPPVALDGDHVYVGLDDATLEVNWRTGEVEDAAHLPSSRFPGVTAGHEVLEDQRGNPSAVIDVATGDRVVSDLPAGPAGASLSPDGRYALLIPWSTCNDDYVCVYDDPASQVVDLSDAASTKLDIGDQAGWTPDGRVIRVTDGAVDLCSPATGDCTSTGISLGDGPVKVGGNSYES